MMPQAQMSLPLNASLDGASQIRDKPLSDTAKKLLKILKNCIGKANAIHGKELMQILGINLRSITENVSSLQDHGYHICSTKKEGYWYSVDPVEYNEWLTKREKEIEDSRQHLKRQRESELGQFLIIHPECKKGKDKNEHSISKTSSNHAE